MGRTIKKLAKDDMFDIGKSESYFSYMASKGLHLKGFSSIFVNFTKGEPSKTKYRIDILSKKPSTEQLEVYKECGWDYVARNGIFYVFSSPENSNAPELHTDLLEQSFTLDNLNKILKKNMFIISIAIILMLAMILKLFFFSKEPYLSLVSGIIISPLIFVIIYLFILYSTIFNYTYVKKVKRNLISGIPINHQENWKRHSLVNKIFSTLIISIALISVVIPITEMVKKDKFTLSETKNNLPVIRLSDIEENPNLQRISKFRDDLDFYNSVIYKWSFLAPTYYDIVESGIVENELWDDKSGTYSPGIHTVYYKLSLKGMANGLVKDLISRYHLPVEPVLKKENTNFDRLYYSTRNSSKEIFASWENNVIYIRYYGNADIDHLIKLLSNLANKS